MSETTRIRTEHEENSLIILETCGNCVSLKNQKMELHRQGKLIYFFFPASAQKKPRHFSFQKEKFNYLKFSSKSTVVSYTKVGKNTDIYSDMTAYKTAYKSTQPVHIMNRTTFLEIVHRIYVYILKCWV